MTEERHNEPHGEQQAERDSQLSAMFDGELPGSECELLARRLTRDDALRSQWSRYAMIGAALRAERGVALHDRVAVRVQSAIGKEAVYGEAGAADSIRPAALPAVKSAGRSGFMRFMYPVAGASIAAGVAAVSIFWLRGAQEPEFNLQASAAAPTQIVLTPEPSGTTVAVNNAAAPRLSNGEPDRYVTPAPNSSTSIAPPARLANYIVAHSEYSGPLSRRMALMGILGAEGGMDADGDDAGAAEAATAAEDSAQ